MSEQARAGPDLLALYDEALPAVYGYLLSRCGNAALAEDLTAETFLAAVTAVKKGTCIPNAPWLLGTARHKLVDHWRAKAREQARLHAVYEEPARDNDPWDERLDALRAQQTLAKLAPHHRMVLMLRYLDDLPVPQVAAEIGRTRHATEALIVRARAAFRRLYTASDEESDKERSGGDD